MAREGQEHVYVVAAEAPRGGADAVDSEGSKEI